MANRIVQLQDRNGDNVFPIAGGTTQGAVTKSMLDEGVFEGPELSEPSTVAYVATDNIQDGAVTASKTNFRTFGSVSHKRSTTAVALAANVWTTIGTITIPANSTSIITASVRIPSVTAAGMFYLMIVSADGTITNGTSSSPSSTASSTRLSTQCVFTTGDSSVSRLVQVQSSVATGTDYVEISEIVLPNLADGNLIN